MTMKWWVAGGALAAALAFGGCKGGGSTEGTGGSGPAGGKSLNAGGTIEHSPNPAEAEVPGNRSTVSPKVLEGTLREIDARQNKVTIYAPDTGSFTLKVNPNTQISLNGKPATLSQLPQGSNVHAAYRMNGMQREALSLDTKAAQQ